MKRTVTFAAPAALAGLLAAVLAGCGGQQEAAAPPAQPPPAAGAPAAVATGAPLGSIRVGDRAVCAICAVKEGTSEPEEVKATLDYRGRTYAFCSLEEKAEFISSPARYAGTGR